MLTFVREFSYTGALQIHRDQSCRLDSYQLVDRLSKHALRSQLWARAPWPVRGRPLYVPLCTVLAYAVVPSRALVLLRRFLYLQHAI